MFYLFSLLKLKDMGSSNVLLHNSFRVPPITGMKGYLRAFGDHLAMQNKKSLPHLKHWLSSFYGTDNFLSHLRDIGSKALSRSTVNRRKQNEEITSIADVGNVSDCNKNFHGVILIRLLNIVIIII